MVADEFLVGVVGLGVVAGSQLSAFRELNGVRVTAVCDVREDIAKKAGEELSARVYTDYKTLIKEGGVDLVMVMTPASTHREIVETSAAAGFHVFCEKPLALTLEDATSMIAACRNAGVKLFYGSSYRYLPAVRKAEELIREGAIGKVQLMTEELVGGHGLDGYVQLGAIHYPHGGPGGAGMGLVDHGVHLIDVFSWFAGGPPERVAGVGQISGEAPVSESMTMWFPGGAVGNLVYNAATYSTVLPNEGMFSGGQGWLTDGSVTERGLWEGDPGSIHVYGTKGSLRIFHYTNALYLNVGIGPQRIELEGRPAFGHFASQLEDCIDAIRKNREPTLPGEIGLRALQTLLAVYAQQPKGKNA